MNSLSTEQAEVDNIIEDMSVLQKYIVLLISANNNESIKGNTLFQKELFLIAKNIKEVEEEASFISDFYGPFSENAKEQLDELSLDEVVVKDKNRMFLSKLGSQVAQKIEQKTPKQELEMISEFKRLLNDLNNEEVLTFIYFTFPEFTDESLVLDEIKKNRKQVALKLYKKEKISLQRATEIAGEPLEKFIKNVEK
ncbi:conserved hypothetical protein [groundwater metagenome]|uniref:Uncharacterized protein n=1 Tax=groundwater metagenome TaxID=717931 RepID=A0A098E7D6_9ZZZZ